MNIFRDIQRKAANIHAKRQAAHYKRLRRDTKLAKLQKAKLERLQEARRERDKARTEVKGLKPKRSLGKFRLPKLVGNLGALTKGMPSEEELNKAVFGSTSPKLPKDITRMETGPSTKDLDDLSKDIFR